MRMLTIGKGTCAATLLAISCLVLPQAHAQGLIVTMTAPASGSTVAGSVPVSASVGVVGLLIVRGVQFKLDGVDLGAEDGSAPYAISWNTAAAGNGSHTLTAVARDSFGVHYTSAPVTVTVANAAPPPPAAKRFEETDPSVAFGAGWTQDVSRSWSAGTASFATSPGGQAVFSFTGPSVSWIGGRAPGTGIARVSVDGMFLAEVDTYSKTEEIRVPMFTASGLADTGHTLTIEATGRQNAAATAALVVVDAFDVPAPAVSRLQETDPDVAYTVGWMQGDTSRAWSAGIAALSAVPGAQATFAFTGTAVSWIGARGPQTGIARVSLDGAFLAEVDTYSATEQLQAALFTADGLTNGNHTLTIEATGRQNAAAQGALIVMDAFEVTSPGNQVQETHPSIAYGAGWLQDNRDKAYSQGSSAESNTVGAQASFTFSGTGVSWIGARGPQTGIARLFLDGVFVQDVDTYALTEGPQHGDFSVTGLAAGNHTLTIQVIGKNPAAVNSWVLVDAFNVIP